MMQWVTTVLVCGLCIQPVTSALNIKIDPRNPGFRASQSSTSWGGDAKRAIDGNRSGYYSQPGGHSCTHTGNRGNQWWRLDLDIAYRLDRVVIYNRVDNPFQNRINGATVYAIKTGSEEVKCGTVTYKPGQDVYTIQCNEAEANRIEIRISGILTLCEVEAFGEPTVAGIYLMDTSALEAIQSSTSGGAVANRAIDGNTDGNYNHGSCSHTNSGTMKPNVWSLKLEKTWFIDHLVIYPRRDCCERLLDTAEIQTPDEVCGRLPYDEGKHRYKAICALNADFVRIHNTGTLTLCEVEIYVKIDASFGRIVPASEDIDWFGDRW